MEFKHTVAQIVKGNVANIDHVHRARVFFSIYVEDTKYLLEIDTMEDDWKTTFIMPSMKAVTLMRWIRKGHEKQDSTLIQLTS